MNNATEIANLSEPENWMADCFELNIELTGDPQQIAPMIEAIRAFPDVTALYIESPHKDATVSLQTLNHLPQKLPDSGLRLCGYLDFHSVQLLPFKFSYFDFQPKSGQHKLSVQLFIYSSGLEKALNDRHHRLAEQYDDQLEKLFARIGLAIFKHQPFRCAQICWEAFASMEDDAVRQRLQEKSTYEALLVPSDGELVYYPTTLIRADDPIRSELRTVDRP
ncbi:MAG TPA: hypothetical protein VLF69_04520 [Candidatus Saccharimonadales bacterium]|nr:hypothetical protein [Candidatus Saccharimonadales bacterium]